MDEQQYVATIEQKLARSGERDRLKQRLRQRLAESGWRDDLKIYCQDVIKKKGLANVTVESLVAEITPRVRASVPENVKAELLASIRKSIESMDAQY
ncbi:hypothetical protein SmJEL517_g03782 [Synchytrium microbalum]|uniref:Transcription and mRNA export factor SUS1 n=1 Tax=Synchytrium microbalum TaxID=1806994 RepID=A0A507C1Q1_9FUNG|nr:uncharacterized protein SmJEL517_g03782 [Synchytrium microbalum]TPX33351.1 hypothetical protein SmJEL517_g03782 [Synchytrium microbalum]